MEQSLYGNGSKSSLASIDDQSRIEELLFTYINESDRVHLQELLGNEECADSILQILLTKIYHNDDNVYFYDKDTLLEAEELLGER